MATSTAGGQALNDGTYVITPKTHTVVDIAPIEDFRTHVGLLSSDASKDAQIVISKDTALHVMERYCDRHFIKNAEIERHVHFHGYVMSLSRYPIDPNHIEVVTYGTEEYHVDYDRGLIRFDNVISNHAVEIAYVGGYEPLPPELVFVFWQVFKTVYDIHGGGSVSSGNLKSVKAGQISISYDTSGGSSNPQGGAVGGLIPITAVSVLDRYKHEWL